MTAKRFDTLPELILAGGVLHLWCHRCARGRDIAGNQAKWVLEQRGISERRLDELAGHIVCGDCGKKDKILVVGWQVPDHVPPPLPMAMRVSSWEQEVAGHFHANRAKAKKLRR